MGNAVGNLLGIVDKRQRSTDTDSRLVGPTLFTCNAEGTTTTAKGADATINTGANVLRVGEKFKLFTSAGVLKEETIFEVTGLASATGTTTVTFTPAAASTPDSGDLLKAVGLGAYQDIETIDDTLIALGQTAAVVAKLSYNDKIYRLRVLQDAASL